MLVIAIFVLGYLAIAFEHSLQINKSAVALLTGVLCWTAYIVPNDASSQTHVVAQLTEHMGDLSGILFFLLGAMTIVELIDAHDGFELITSRVTTRSRRKLLLVIAAFSFVLSAVLDNLTTSIVMMSLTRKLVGDARDRMYYGGAIVIAANSGGVWSPIGDVTTTMLWIGGHITTTHIIKSLLLPAFVSVAVPVAWMALQMRGDIANPMLAETAHKNLPTTPLERKLVLFTGMGVLVLVPVFKTVTHLPPFAGILLGLGVLWTLTELIHKRKNDDNRSALSVSAALQRIDAPSVLFFLGILLAISALESAGYLHGLAAWMERAIGNVDVITMSIGLSSAIVDNVPLVAASQGMYPLTTFGPDHHFWTFLAYCAGTGGSILIIGSAAGVAVMGIQQISFGWYLKRISLPALVGYLAGAGVYLAVVYAT